VVRISDGKEITSNSQTLDGRMILKWIFNEWEDVNWIHFAEDSEY
jgi:hypothetical protein